MVARIPAGDEGGMGLGRATRWLLSVHTNPYAQVNYGTGADVNDGSFQSGAPRFEPNGRTRATLRFQSLARGTQTVTGRGSISA